jgi:ribonuclease VapC
VIVDTSALVTVVFKEPGYEAVLHKLSTSPSSGIGTPTLAETGLVLSARLGRDPLGLLVRLLEEFDIDEVPFAEEHWRAAVTAFRRFGRGRHPAQLNLGDCLSYAVAKLADEALLFVGDDFTKTDLTPA